MAVCSLKSDNEFISLDDAGLILVYSYDGDTNDFEMHRSSSFASGRLHRSAFVGPTVFHCTALELFGTTIEGAKFKELCDELNALEQRGLSVLVNRLGLCISKPSHYAYEKTVRINDHFRWSKYGVKLPQDAIVRSVELRRSVELAACKKQLEEKSAELKELESLLSEVAEATKELRLSLEEKTAELKDCKQELERSKEEESVLFRQKVVEATKECRDELERSKKKLESLSSKKVEVVNNLTHAFNSALRYLDDH